MKKILLFLTIILISSNGYADTSPEFTVKINGVAQCGVLAPDQTLSVSLDFDPADLSGKLAEWWVAVHKSPDDAAEPGGWFSFISPPQRKWVEGIQPYNVLPLLKISDFPLFDITLKPGNYSFYFVADMNINGTPDIDHYDSIDVRIGPRAEANFYEIDPVSFRLSGKPYKSSPSRVFHSFHPARKNSSKKPLFIFVNGGPGANTTEGLFSANTSPFSNTLDGWVQGKPVIENQYSWTEMGNLLYIDAPLTGFSYNILPDGATDSSLEFGLKNCNPFVDASQVLRVVLKFLADHEDLQKNEVILVGESYGGTRTAIMLNMILFYGKYAKEASDQVYVDEALSQEIKNHLDVVFPENSSAGHEPVKIATQFKRHIMIEPQLTGNYQTELTGEAFEKPDSVIYKIADQTGTTYEPCPADDPKCIRQDNALEFVMREALRDMYKYPNPCVWSWIVGGVTDYFLNTVNNSSKMLELDISTIQPFYAKNRTNAYKYRADTSYSSFSDDNNNLDNLPPSLKSSVSVFFDNENLIKSKIGEILASENLGLTMIPSIFGSLKNQDAYYSFFMNFDVLRGFYSAEAKEQDVDPESTRYGKLFLENLPYLEVMITDAPLDLSIYSSVLPASFKKYTDIVSDVTEERECDDCDAYFYVNYKPDSLSNGKTPDKRRVFFPHYKYAGHMVSLDMPYKLFNDVKAWIEK